MKGTISPHSYRLENSVGNNKKELKEALRELESHGIIYISNNKKELKVLGVADAVYEALEK